MPAPPTLPPAVDYPLARAARQRYSFYAPTFSDFVLARDLSDKMNRARDLKNQPELTVRAGRLAAAALLDEMIAEVIAIYVEQVEPEALEGAPKFLDENVGERGVAELLDQLDELYAPVLPLEGRPRAVERLMRLHLANVNPAQQLFRELFDDTPLRDTSYADVVPALEAYFATLPPFGPDQVTLFEFLHAPMQLFPESVEDQLRFILRDWGQFLPQLTTRLLLNLDLIREEEKPTFFGPGPALVPDYNSYNDGSGVGMQEFEAFTPDRDWMPEVVLIAKQTYVWLDQLSKKYGRHIYRLDQVPDEELDELASCGITGLWLIGVWQRSKASQKIKQITGNPDAISSAYSLYSYGIAWEIGGEEALTDLRTRAARRGIRMASDMVPNHMAIDSQWVIEHPDWFISLPYPPYPHANFDTPDLCEDPRVAVHIEAGYYSKTDASVVFKRVDKNSGETRYIYHGNDGTSFPWNDTAQLNYLLPEVREAALQTILHVAREFPIIRFDAAMTLAKRHYHRLWFPAPGHGGDIPSRAGRGITAEEFEAAFPKEFWRDVVDRIAVEAPDTLLLAEAFWLMEGYFVRTLGMHRVYNSAFMVMLRDEENDKYRQTLKNTLEFDPDILGRFVNFMNNPDEKTSVEQFGKGDKYFGVCTLLATLPGLPMLGHGQIEGYAEKYGMEYPRAYWDEKPDEPFVAYHQKVIFPLLHKRALFAGSDNFTLYDFWSGEGRVNEDVFVFSNSKHDERALVIYNNRHAKTSGWIRTSVSFADKKPDGSKDLATRRLDFALQIKSGDRQWVIFRDNHTDLEYLRPAAELVDKGLYVELGEYGCHVFLNWRQITDSLGHYAMLAEKLAGQGVPNVDIAVKELVLEPLLTPLRELFEWPLWKSLWESRHAKSKTAKAEFAAAWKSWETRAAIFEREACLFLHRPPIVRDGAASVASTPSGKLPLGKAPAGEAAGAKVKTAAVTQSANGVTNSDHAPAGWLELASARLKSVLALPAPFQGAEAAHWDAHLAEPQQYLALMWWAALQDTGELLGGGDKRPLSEKSRSAFDEWLVDLMLEPALIDAAVEPEAAAHAVALVRLLLAHTASKPTSPFAFLNAVLNDDEGRSFLGVNRFEGTLWFQQEGLDELLAWLRLTSTLEGSDLPLDELETAAATSDFKLVKLMEKLAPEPILTKSS